jgi:hypothetical protein
MAYSGLVQTYRYFSFYLASSVVIDLLGLLFNRGPLGYAYALFWIITTSLLVVMLLAAVFELYGLVIHRFTGLGNIGTWVLIAAAAIGILISAGIGMVDAKAIRLDGLLAAIAFGKRWLLSVTAVLLVITSWFYFRHRIMRTRNLVVHLRVLTLYCVISAAACFWVNLRINTQVGSAVLISGSFLCYCLWFRFLSRAGEHSTAQPSTPEQIDLARLRRQQLEKLVDDLERPDRDDHGRGPQPE